MRRRRRARAAPAPVAAAGVLTDARTRLVLRLGLGAKHLPHARAAALLDPLQKHIVPERRGEVADRAADGAGRASRSGDDARARTGRASAAAAANDDEDDDEDGDETRERRGRGRAGAGSKQRPAGFDVKRALRAERASLASPNAKKNRRKKERRRARKLVVAAESGAESGAGASL